MWYNGSNSYENSDQSLFIPLIPLFGFKKYSGDLRNGEKNPNIIGIVTKVNVVKGFGVCDYQNNRIILTEEENKMHLIVEQSCSNVVAITTSNGSGNRFVKMYESEFLSEEYYVPTLNIVYKYGVELFYTDNVNKEALDKFANRIQKYYEDRKE